jgi:hypothetical protein
LRRAIDTCLHRHSMCQQESQRGNESPRGQFGPPERK